MIKPAWLWRMDGCSRDVGYMTKKKKEKKENVFEPQYKTLLEIKPNMMPSFGIRISLEFEAISLGFDTIADFKLFHPGSFLSPVFYFHLHNGKKSQTDPLVFRTKFMTCCLTFQAIRLYSGTVQRVVTQLSKIKAIDLALDHIEQSSYTDFIVFLIPSLFYNHYIIAIFKTLFFWMSF